MKLFTVINEGFAKTNGGIEYVATQNDPDKNKVDTRIKEDNGEIKVNAVKLNKSGVTCFVLYQNVPNDIGNFFKKRMYGNSRMKTITPSYDETIDSDTDYENGIDKKFAHSMNAFYIKSAKYASRIIRKVIKNKIDYIVFPESSGSLVISSGENRNEGNMVGRILFNLRNMGYPIEVLGSYENAFFKKSDANFPMHNVPVNKRGELDNKFEINNDFKSDELKGKSFLVFDDNMCSGTTLDNCCLRLRDAGAYVVAMVFSRLKSSNRQKTIKKDDSRGIEFNRSLYMRNNDVPKNPRGYTLTSEEYNNLEDIQKRYYRFRCEGGDYADFKLKYNLSSAKNRDKAKLIQDLRLFLINKKKEMEYVLPEQKNRNKTIVLTEEQIKRLKNRM